MNRTAAVVMAALALAATGTALANEELAKKSGCLTCHNVTGGKKIGPSFKDAAKKGEEKILAALDDKKKHGAVKASDADKKTLAAWIAGMK
ncbi:MAG TPA: cytochrome C-551 [Usitatibacter sp.]|nr:cytochrome C-551 [Usitatibacter sp.]